MPNTTLTRADGIFGKHRVLGVGVKYPPHDQRRGDLVAGVSECRVLHFGYLSVGYSAPRCREAAEAKVRNLISSRRTVSFFVQSSATLLEGPAKMIEKGQVRPVVERSYTWDELAEAHRRIETGRVAGKIAVVPTGQYPPSGSVERHRLRLRSPQVALEAHGVVCLLQPSDQFIIEVGVGSDANGACSRSS
jgi:hypothetical protein